MDELSLNNLMVSGFIDAKSLLAIESHTKVNEHGYMHVEAILDQETGKRLMNQSFENQALTLTMIKEKRPIFSGWITCGTVLFKNDVYYFHGDAVSGSIKFDQKKRSRSFQDIDMSYSSLFRQVAGSERNIVITRGNQQSIGQLIVQYEETDWEFCKRIASHLGTVVIPETTNIYPQIAIGIIHGVTYNLDQGELVSIKKDLECYRHKRALSSCNPSDFVSYTLLDERNLNLGDKVNINGIKYIIVEKSMCLKNGMLEFLYQLGTEAAFGCTRYYNKKIQGMSLEGKVKSTRREILRVQLDIDADNENAKPVYDFVYTPITGNIMYSMPEKGARISVYFPSHDEGDARAIHCRNLDDEHHETKRMHTPCGIGLTYRPNSIRFSVKRKRETAIGIVDRVGVYFHTNRNIRMRAAKSISINGAMVGVKATSQTVLQQNENAIYITGNEAVIHTGKLQMCTPLVTPIETPVTRKKELTQDFCDLGCNLIGGLTAGATDPLGSALLSAVPTVCNTKSKLSIFDLFGITKG